MQSGARVLVVTLVALVGLALPLACAGKVEAPPESKPDTGPTATATATGTGTPEKCAACVDARCKATWDACVAEPACVAQTDCISACTSAACESGCRSAHPSAAGDAAQACFRGPCAADCTH